jgi:tetratricopeptide (TPR) repeat protein
MGRYYQDSEHYSKAIELLEQAPKANNNPLIKATISRLHFYLEMNDIAYSELSEIIKLKSQTAFSALIKQANKSYDYQEYNLAIIFYKKAITMKPKDTGTRLDLAKAYYSNNQPEKTISELHKALEIDSKNAVIYYNLGYVYWQKRSDATTAISYFEKYLELDPNGELAKQAQHNINYIKKELKG